MILTIDNLKILAIVYRILMNFLNLTNSKILMIDDLKILVIVYRI